MGKKIFFYYRNALETIFLWHEHSGNYIFYYKNALETISFLLQKCVRNYFFLLQERVGNYFFLLQECIRNCIFLLEECVGIFLFYYRHVLGSDFYYRNAISVSCKTVQWILIWNKINIWKCNFDLSCIIKLEMLMAETKKKKLKGMQTRPLHLVL